MPKQYDSPPAMVIDPKKTYRAKMETSKGTISIELFADRAPITVNNFVFLCRDGFYDDVIFHRVLDGFMAQGGDPTGSGRGGPGYRWDDEASALRIPHDAPGTLSMANAGPNSNGSQFFITFAPTPHLDGRHAVFGRVNDEEGLRVLSALQRIDPQRPNRAIVADKIKSVTIEEG
ncbi:MAG: peptidylprolyl isomerase [Chloroflexi bacterium]|nr:peptidylprolyl isomerase [Chloroflexota bacterium]